MSTNLTYGMTDKGFRPKRLNDIVTNLLSKIQGITDPKTGEHPLSGESSNTILGQFTGIIAQEIAVCWEQMYTAANLYDPLNNIGVPLKAQVQINGINPSYGAPTKIPVTIYGNEGIVVQAGSLITNSTRTITFSIDNNIMIEKHTEEEQVSVYGTGTATCTTTGEINVEADTITSIVNPMLGWSGVTNGAPLTVGTNPDSDENLHIKQQRATSATSYRHVEALYAGIINVDGVIFAHVYQNPTSTTDSRGIAAKTIAAVVVGGDDQEVGKAIALKAPMLSNFQGNLSNPYTDTDVFGTITTYQFYRPTNVQIDIDMEIVITNANYYPEDAIDLIKESIVNYADYGLSPSLGFPPGESVARSRLYTPINEVPGFKVKTLKIAKHGETVQEQDVAIAWNEVAQFLSDNINIDIVNE